MKNKEIIVKKYLKYIKDENNRILDEENMALDRKLFKEKDLVDNIILDRTIMSNYVTIDILCSLISGKAYLDYNSINATIGCEIVDDYLQDNLSLDDFYELLVAYTEYMSDNMEEEDLIKLWKRKKRVK